MKKYKKHSKAFRVVWLLIFHFHLKCRLPWGDFLDLAATWMQRDYHAKWNRSDREKQMPCDIAYMWNLKCDTGEPGCDTEWRRQWQPTPALLPGESPGQRSLVGRVRHNWATDGLQSMGYKELDMTEWLILSYVYAHVKVIMMCWDKIIYYTVVFC